LYDRPIVTEVVQAGAWYEAEAYHQEYFVRNPFQGYCQFVVGPKVAKFRKQFASRLRS
jgi:peptide-methionine (S)-S-oxide reductase